MRHILMITALVVGLLTLPACKTTHEDVVKKEVAGQKEIRDAELNVDKKKAEAAEDIGRARAKGDIAAEEKEKIEATKKIAKAEGKVDDKKIDVTEDVLDAERKAGETTGQFQRE